MHCFHVYLSGKKCPAAFVELRLTSTFPCVCRCRVVGFFYSPSLSSLLFSGFLNFLSKLLSNHVRCSLSIFPIYQPLFSSRNVALQIVAATHWNLLGKMSHITNSVFQIRIILVFGQPTMTTVCESSR